MNLFSAYKYLFYRMYAWNLRTWGKVDAPEYTALVSVSFLLYLNLFTLLIGVELLSGLVIHKQIEVIHGLIIALAIGVINYFIFLRQDKYKEVAKQFKKENPIEKKKRFIWCTAYVIFSIVSFFGLLIILSPYPRK